MGQRHVQYYRIKLISCIKIIKMNVIGSIHRSKITLGDCKRKKIKWLNKLELTKAHVIIEKLEKAHESVKSNSDNSTGQLQEQLGLKNDEINDLNARIEALTNEKETLQTKLDGLITKHKSMSVEFNQTLNAQKITIRDLEKKIDSLQS